MILPIQLIPLAQQLIQTPLHDRRLVCQTFRIILFELLNSLLQLPDFVKTVFLAQVK